MKSVTEFYRASNTRDGLRSSCIPCHKEQVANSKSRNGYPPEETRRKRLWRMYRLREADWEALFNAQGRKCAICKTETPATYWTVDHDHECCPGKKSCGQCVRGILCNVCNQGLGQFQDNINLLNRAASYLEGRHESRS